MDNYSVILAIVAVLSLAVQGLVKALDIVKKKKDNNSNEINQRLPENFKQEWENVYDWSKEMYFMHDRRDPITGIPVWYATKDAQELLKDHAKSLRIISESYAAQTEILRNLQELVRETFNKINDQTKKD